MRALALTAGLLLGLVAAAAGFPQFRLFEQPNLPRATVASLLRYGGAWFEFARDAGAGQPVLGLDYAVPLCSTLLPGEDAGNWWCLSGDGGTVQGGLGMVAFGSPADGTSTILPNGPSGGAESAKRLTATDGYAVGAAANNDTTGLTVCWFGAVDTTTGNPILMSHASSYASAATDSWYLRALTTGVRLDVSTGAATADPTTATAPTNGALHLLCGTWSAAAGAEACLDGVCTAAIALASMQALNVKDTINGANGAANAGGAGRVFGAFYTPVRLSDARIAAISHAVLADQPRGVTGDGDAGVNLALTRATVKACPADTTGAALSTLPSGRPCITMGGLHAEGAATNVCLQSEDFTNAAYANFIAGAGTNPTKNTANSFVAPSGTLTAESVTFNATGAADSSALSQTILTAAAYSCSVYAQGNATTNSGTFDVCMDTAASTTCAPCAYTLGSAVRCRLENVTSKASGLFYVGNLSSKNGGTTRPGQTVTLWGAQCETGSVATTYIPTTSASATRNAETTPFGMQTLALATTGSAAATMTSYTASPGGGALFLATGGRPLYMTGGNILDYDGTNTGTRALSGPLTNERWSADWSGAAMHIYAPDAGVTTSTFAGRMDTGATDAGYIGGNATTGGIGGVISNVCVDPSPTRCR